MFEYYNPNPAERHTGDCVYRGLTYFLGITWMKAVMDLVLFTANRGLVNFTYISTVTEYLKQKGFRRCKPECAMTVAAFIQRYALPGHAYLIMLEKPKHVTVVSTEGKILDIGDCSHATIKYFWKN